jgi:putative zinc finger/helix-turn-helix YgiT family protein
MHMSKLDTAKKPFPWRCTNCREKAVREAIIDYIATMEYDGRTYSVEMKKFRVPRCDNCGQVSPDAEALGAITDAFLRQEELLTPAEIRGYREKLNFTQRELAARLGVAEATVSRWENGVQIQQRSLDNLLRLFFGLPQVREILIANQIATLGLGVEPQNAQ